MSRNVRVLRCSPADVFRVLEDGWLFPAWVVGASRMREVDEAWPRVGTRLHHSFGVWPVLIDDVTLVEAYDPPHRIVLRPKGWPIGEARVTIDVKPRGADSVVRIQEEAVAGPGRLVPAPLLDVGLYWRNTETLHRLAYLAEGISDSPQRQTTAETEIGDASP
jgi:uncharacterized protein YndB with AHSA1/START domain